MAVYVNPQNGERYENVPDDQTERAASFGLVPEAQAQAEERSGGFIDTVRTGAEEGIRQVASGAAAAVRGLSTMGGEVDAMGNPTELVDPIDVKGADLAPGVFTDAALERREVNPTAAAIGGTLPTIAASVAAPGGLAATLGIDLASAAAQEATDAELAGEGINGEHILRNAALNAVFSGVAGAIPMGARALVRGTDDLVTRTAKAATAKLESQGEKAIANKASAIVGEADEALAGVKMPKVANNPGSQRQALEDIADAFEKTSPEAKQVRELAGKPAQARYRGLQDIVAELPEESDLAATLGDNLRRADLWGQKAVDFDSNLAAARALRPVDGSGAEAWQKFADALRTLPDASLAKHADLLEELAQAKALDGLSVRGVGGAIGSSLGKAALGIGAEEAVETGFKGAGALLGGAIGGTPGAAAGWLAGRALNKRFGESAVSMLTDQAATAIGGSAALASSSPLVQAARALKSFAESDRKLTARLLVNPEAAQKYARILGDAPTALSRFQGDDETAAQAMQRHQQTLRQLGNDPSAMLGLLGEELGNLDQQSPALYRQAVAQAAKVHEFLQAEIPKPRGVSVARPQGTPASPLEIRTYALKFGAATDPQSVMADARAGRLRREQADTLQKLWPDEYNQLRQDVIQQLGHGSSTATRQRMNLLFGLDASIDPALGMRTRRLVAAARVKSQQAQVGGSKPNSSFAPKSPPSQAGQMPAGEAALQLGPSMSR